jgi:NAD(P)-dependent dehydrogenase (short-subunit alcohol dehydrogenase family)
MLKDKIILVTGAGDGIGKAVAIKYAALGANLILLGRTLSNLEESYDEIISNGSPTPMISLMDLSKADANDYQDLIDNLSNKYGCLDGLLLNAGTLGDRSPISQYDVPTWVNTLHVNLTAQFILTQTLLPALYKSKNASVIFTSSGVGKIGKAFWGAYAVSKFGIEALCQILSAEHHNEPSVRFNCINPGPVQTKMRKLAYPLEDEKLLLKPEDILDKYIWLMSDDSLDIDGQSIDCQKS